MIRTLKLRIHVALIVTLAATAGGVLAGFFLGRALEIERAKSKLEQEVQRSMADSESASREARALLATLNAAPYAFCSDAELAYFRNLVFQADYLKDAGRIRNGKLLCSATLGRLDPPIAEGAPTFSQPDGTKVYKQFAPFHASDLLIVALQLGDSYVTFNPHIATHRASPPMQYATTAINDPTWQTSRFIAAFPHATRAILTTDGQGKLGNSLYATRCSTRYSNCLTNYMAIPDVLLANRAGLDAYSALGGLIGVCFGIIFSLLYQRNQSMEMQLRRAIRGDQLQVNYQPIVDVVSGRIVGAEALARWTDEDGFAVSPDVFVKIAEERGFVGEITRLVVRRVLHDFAETLHTQPYFRVSINVAAADLSDAAFLPMLEQALEQARLGAQSLVIEITESSTVRQEVAKETIHRLRERGHHVHIDDFGTGYSSLAYLQELSVDAIKIDRAFTQAIGTQSVTVGIMAQILGMAEALNLQVIVEGVETVEQAGYFAGLERPICAQGWLYGRPVSAEEFQILLAAEEMKTETLDCTS